MTVGQAEFYDQKFRTSNRNTHDRAFSLSAQQAEIEAAYRQDGVGMPFMPIILVSSGTRAFPSARDLPTRAGTPSAILPTSGSIAQVSHFGPCD
jgi:hypothetical protein